MFTKLVIFEKTRRNAPRKTSVCSSALYLLVTLAVSNVKWHAFLRWKSWSIAQGELPVESCFHSVVFLLLFQVSLPRAYHLTRSKKRRLGIPSVSPISLLSTSPLQKHVSRLPFQIQWLSTPYRIPISQCALVESFKSAVYSLAQI